MNASEGVGAVPVTFVSVTKGVDAQGSTRYGLHFMHAPTEPALVTINGQRPGILTVDETDFAKLLRSMVDVANAEDQGSMRAIYQGLTEAAK